MLIRETLDAYLFLARLTPQLAESEDSGVAELAAKAVLGDGKALGDLYMRYARSLTKIAVPYVGYDGAQDVVQDLFLKISKGKFASHAASLKSDGRGVFPFFATAIKRAAIDVRRRKQPHSIGGGALGDTDVSNKTDFDPADPMTDKNYVEPLSKDERDMVTQVIQRAIESAKLTTQERKYIETLLGRPGEEMKDITRFFSGATDADRDEESLAAIAKGIWPEKSANAAQVHGNRTRERFLKQFCQHPDLLKLLPDGRQTLKATLKAKQLKPVCAKFDEDVVVQFAWQLELIEDTDLDNMDNVDSTRDKAYAGVLRWICQVT